MRRMKIHQVVESLKMKGFEHDACDLDEGVRNVLEDYYIDTDFSEEELKQIELDLREIAESNEFAEISRMISEESNRVDINV